MKVSGRRKTKWCIELLLFLFLFPGLLLLGCQKREEKASCFTEYLDVDLSQFPSHQYNDVPERRDADQVIKADKAVKLTFYGATRIVAGSCTLLEYKGKKILIDAGIFYNPNLIPLDQRFEFNPRKLDYVILTHAHGDHSGRIPLLYRKGYQGKVYCTPPTKDISDIMLQLGVRIGTHSRRVDFKNKSVHSRRCERARTLGPNEHLDVRKASVWLDNMGYHPCHSCRKRVERDKARLSRKVTDLFHTVNFGETVRLGDEISFRFHNAGHILGSSQVELVLGEGEEAVTIIFTGDFGNIVSPLVKTPSFLDDADYLITESTYGAVRKEFRKPYFQDFINDLVAAVRREERVIIPSFVLSKSQKVISLLAELAYTGKISRHCPIIITSPTVAKLNEVYRKYLEEEPEEYFALEIAKRRHWRNPFECKHIFLGSLKSYQRKFGKIRTPAIFLVSSGMMDFASALEMAENYLSDPRTNFYIVGWQSPDSVGRAAMKLTEVVIKGRAIPVKAKVKKFGQFSAHADLNTLLKNVRHYRRLKGVIVNHGEAESAVNLAQLIEEYPGCRVFVPAFLDTVWLDKKSFLKVKHDYSYNAQKTRQLDPGLELPRSSLEKRHQVAYNNLALAHRAYLEGNLALALKYARDATLRYPALADAHYLMGQVYHDQGRDRAMRESFQKAVRINPYDYRYYLALAKSYYQEDKIEDAIREFRTCLFYQPGEIEALTLLGEIYCNSERAAVGLELLKAANSLDPYDEEVSTKLEKTVRNREKRRVYYVASRKRRYFHYPWCPAARMVSEQNLIRFNSRSAALQKGLTPCPQCNP